MPEPKKYIMPWRELRKLEYVARQAQMRDQGEVCGLLSADFRNRLVLSLLPNRSRRFGSPVLGSCATRLTHVAIALKTPLPFTPAV